jgi:Sec-independent protein translocase protein TatA
VGNDTLLVLIVILIIALIWRGPKTLPDIGRMFGRGVREARTEAAKLRSGNDDDTGGSPSTSA